MSKKHHNQKNKFANLIWLFSEICFGELEAGEKTDIQIMRTGTWKHSMYGDIIIDDKDLSQFIKNFNDNVRRIKLAVDENHDHDHKAVGWFRSLKKVGNALFATIEWTARGAELVNNKEYRYFSPELATLYTDDETGKVFKNVLLGGGITNRPFFKAMKPLMASEENATGETFYNLTFSKNMKTLLQMLAAVADKGTANEADKAEILKKFSELDKDDQSPEIREAMTSIGIKFDEGEDEKPVEEKPADQEEAGGEEETTETKTTEAEAEEVEDKEDEKTEATAEVVEASEKTVTIKASEFKDLQKSLSSMARKIKTQEADKQVSGLMFSESNKTGIVLPKDKDDIVAFASSLSDAQANKFYEILESVNNGVTESIGKFAEIGLDSPADVHAYSDEVSFLETKLGLSKEDAEAVAKEYAEAKKTNN